MKDPFSFNILPQIHAGRALGRCHAALGQRSQSASAFDTAFKLAELGQHVMSQVLTARDWALAESSGANAGVEQTEQAGRLRLSEVLGQMPEAARGAFAL